MAGLPWFELAVDMPDDPKCVALGVRLKNPLAFGYVVRLYAYCYRHGTDTFIGLGAPGTIENAAGWRGKTGALFSALQAEGFIDFTPAATYVIHGVAARLVPTLAKMERDRERAKHRRDDVAKGIGRSVGVRRTSRGRTADVHGDIDKDKDRDLKAVDQRDGSEGAADTSRLLRPLPELPPFERLRCEISRDLGVMGAGGKGIASPGGRSLGEQIRNAVAAIEKHGFDAVRDACVTHARASGLQPEVMTFFARVIAGLAEGDGPKRKRQPGENPAITDADYDNPDAWWSLPAFNARKRRNAA